MPIILRSVPKEFVIFPFIDYSIGDYNDSELIQERGCRYDSTLFETVIPTTNKKYLFSGYFGCYKYFEKYEKQIKHSFRFDTAIKKQIDSFYDEYTVVNSSIPNKRKLCGVHIRTADVRHEPNPLYAMPSAAFIKKAVELIQTKDSTIRFLVCSNDMEYCKELFQSLFPIDTIFFNKGKFEDFVMLSRCDHNILTPGSYGWWAAYLNENENKTVIGIHPIFNLKREGFSETDDSDFYPKNWIVLEN